MGCWMKIIFPIILTVFVLILIAACAPSVPVSPEEKAVFGTKGLAGKAIEDCTRNGATTCCPSRTQGTCTAATNGITFTMGTQTHTMENKCYTYTSQGTSRTEGKKFSCLSSTQAQWCSTLCDAGQSCGNGECGGTATTSTGAPEQVTPGQYGTYPEGTYTGQAPSEAQPGRQQVPPGVTPGTPPEGGYQASGSYSGTLTVLWPNGGETIPQETSPTIVWSGGEQGWTVRLDAHDPAVPSNTYIAANLSNTGSYVWPASLLASTAPGTYKIRLACTSCDPEQVDYSDQTFTIVSPSTIMEEVVGEEVSPAAPPPGVCTGTFTSNTELCSDDDQGLVQDTPFTFVSACSDGLQCERKCTLGYKKPTTGQNCVPTVCTGSYAAASTLCSGDNTILAVDTPHTLVNACTNAVKCERTCNANYKRSGTKCLKISGQSCTSNSQCFSGKCSAKKCTAR